MNRNRVIAGYVLATLGTAALVLAFHPFREHLAPVTVGFTFLTLVVLAVAVGGLGPGIVASILGFLSFNFFFLPPLDTFRIAKPEYIVVLFVFLGLSVLISYLIGESQARADAAESRERELRMQQDLTYALVDPRPGSESYDFVLGTIVGRFHFDEAALMIQPRADMAGLEEVSVVRSETPSQAEDDPLEERLVLNVGRRNLGLLALRGRRPPLEPSERRILEAFSNQLALVLERDRLLRTVADAKRLGA
jgi:two-component system, OmpR family, sensor histidine kinase KdpD